MERGEAIDKMHNVKRSLCAQGLVWPDEYQAILDELTSRNGDWQAAAQKAALIDLVSATLIQQIEHLAIDLVLRAWALSEVGVLDYAKIKNKCQKIMGKKVNANTLDALRELSKEVRANVTN